MRISDIIDDNSTKQDFVAHVDEATYGMTVINHFKDGKTIVYRRIRVTRGRPFRPFDPTRLNERKRTILGLSLMLQGWEIEHVAMFLGQSLESAKETYRDRRENDA